MRFVYEFFIAWIVACGIKLVIDPCARKLVWGVAADSPRQTFIVDSPPLDASFYIHQWTFSDLARIRRINEERGRAYALEWERDREREARE